MNLQIDRPEQKARLEAHMNPAGIKADDLAAGAVSGTAIPAGGVTTAMMAAGAGTLPKLDLSALKLLAADGVNSTGGDTQVTLTGAVIGNRVVAIFGHVKAAAGANSFLLPVIGTGFEAVISVTDKIVQKQAAGDLSLNTYLFLLAPAAA